MPIITAKSGWAHGRSSPALGPGTVGLGHHEARGHLLGLAKIVFTKGCASHETVPV